MKWRRKKSWKWPPHLWFGKSEWCCFLLEEEGLSTEQNGGYEKRQGWVRPWGWWMFVTVRPPTRKTKMLWKYRSAAQERSEVGDTAYRGDQHREVKQNDTQQWGLRREESQSEGMSTMKEQEKKMSKRMRASHNLESIWRVQKTMRVTKKHCPAGREELRSAQGIWQRWGHPRKAALWVSVKQCGEQAARRVWSTWEVTEEIEGTPCFPKSKLWTKEGVETLEGRGDNKHTGQWQGWDCKLTWWD